MSETVTYETDFYAWAIQNAQLLREGKLTKIDAEHIAEELESMSASDRRELLNRLQVLLSHLLKHQYQSERRSKSWLLAISHQRTSSFAQSNGPMLNFKLPIQIWIQSQPVQDVLLYG